MLTEQREVRSKWKDHFRGLLKVDAGSLSVERQKVWKMRLQRRRIGGNDGS